MSQEIDEIKSRLDLVEIMGEYIKLIPAGTSYKALCPFHHEKSPSLIVNPQKQFWRCFGCNEGGDLFTFVTKIENVEFVEALRMLAQRAGVTLSRERPEATGHKDRLYQACDITARYWHRVLLDSPRAAKARDYIASRGLSEEMIEQFDLGYAVDEWDNLLQFLSRKHFSHEEMLGAGFITRRQQGSGFYDRFRGRLMFPITDVHGQVVGFGGRVIESSEAAKYINTSQTELYNKSAIVYGLYQAKDAIKRADLCIIVEGYMDVIPSHQAGVTNVVSISGTAMTIEQVRLIKRYTRNIALALDMDAAGQQAALRSVEVASGEDMNITVITVPNGKDPGECIAEDPALWRGAIAAARPVMAYFIERALAGRSMTDARDKKGAIAFVLTRLALIANPVERDHWIHEAAQVFSVSESVIRELVDKVRRPAPTAPVTAATGPAATAPSTDQVAAERVLAALLAWPIQLPSVVAQLEPGHFLHEPAAGLYKKIILFYNNHIDLFSTVSTDHGQFDLFAMLTDWFRHENMADTTSTELMERSYLLAQRDYIDLDERSARQELDGAISALKRASVSDQTGRLQMELRQAEARGDHDRVQVLMSELAALVRQKQILDG